MQLLTPGQLIQERYQIVRLLGSGGFGAVYLAEDQRLARPVAIKEMNAARLDYQERQIAAQLFEREALMLAQLDHIGLTRVWDYFQQGDQVFLVMEYVPGLTLRELVNNGPLPEPFVLECALQLCEVLDYLHARRPPVIFRDLKPANVMLVVPPGSDPQEVLSAPPASLTFELIDFGIARIFKPDQVSDTLIIGTPGYAPPEQYGQGQTDARSDIYSLGATLHHLLSGKVPNSVPLPALSSVAPTVSPALARVVERATALDPQDRYPTIALMRNDLIAAANARHVVRAPVGQARTAAPFVDPPARQPKPNITSLLPRVPAPAGATTRRSSPLPLVLLAVVVLGLVVLGLGVVGVLRRPALGNPDDSASGTAPSGSARTPAGIAKAEWLLDGAPGRIAYGQAGVQGSYNVLVATLDGQPPQRITGDGASISPAWSPDGSRLAITRTGNPNSAIFVGGLAKRDFVQVSPPDVYARYSAWSPDGQRLAFAAGPGRSGPFRLAIVDLASGAVSYPGPSGVAWISWSSRGSLAYSAATAPGQPQDIFVLNADGSSRNLTNTPDVEEDFPSWSPDGRRLAFVASPAGGQHLNERQIYLINADGSARSQLTSVPGPQTNPVWSPDGGWLAYLSKAGGGDWQVWAIRADGKTPRQLTFGAQQKFYLAWAAGKP
jgi:Tol biopolymer transport system component/tRNA A-37 threonylcarbamoyl transferase component Bud32